MMWLGMDVVGYSPSTHTQTMPHPHPHHQQYQFACHELKKTLFFMICGPCFWFLVTQIPVSWFRCKMKSWSGCSWECSEILIMILQRLSVEIFFKNRQKPSKNTVSGPKKMFWVLMNIPPRVRHGYRRSGTLDSYLYPCGTHTLNPWGYQVPLSCTKPELQL